MRVIHFVWGNALDLVAEDHAYSLDNTAYLCRVSMLPVGKKTKGHIEL